MLAGAANSNKLSYVAQHAHTINKELALMLSEMAPKSCHVPLVRSRMPVALSVADVLLPAKVP